MLTDTFGEKSDGYWSLSFHPDGEHLALGTTSDYVVVARLSDGKFIFDKSVHQGRIWDMTYTRDGGRLIFGGDEGVAYVWHLG
jgi:WD40 repeat protein